MAEDVRTSISSSYNLCLQSFDKLKRLLVEPECAFRDELDQEDLRDQEGRFRVWAGNSGAHRTGRVSLDYKLREASHVHAKVIDLLGDLNSSLQEAISIINHDYRSDAGSSVDSGSSSDSASSSDDGSSIMSGPSLPAESLPTTTELEYTLLDVMHVITCLYKFSIALRQPAPRDRLHKYAAINVSHFELFDIGHAREKFPGAATYLVERLGKANMRRRQLLKYHRRHHDKIARYADLPLAPDSPKPEMETPEDEEVETPQPRPTWGKVLAPEDFALHQSGPGTIATTMNTQTTVTTINPKFNPKNLDDIDVESETGQSQTSFASSSAGDAAKLKVPPPPGVDSLDGTPFECPYCFTMVIMRNSRSWMRHVMKDLKAYVCTFEHCAKPDQLFEYRHDWHEHEMQAHRREWVCEDCRKTFHTRSEIITHLRTTHGSLFTEKQLPVIADRCERANTTDQPCPLCDIPVLPPARLRSHIARHLQQLALFVLPRGGEVVDDNVQSVGAQRSEYSDDEHSSDDKDSKEDLEFDSNPSRENSEADCAELQKSEPEAAKPESPATSAPVTSDRVLYPEKYLHPHIETFFGDLPPPRNTELAKLHAEAAELIRHDHLEPVAAIYERIPWPSDIESKREYIAYFRAMAELLWKRERKDDAITLLSDISAHNGTAEKLLAAELIAAGERCAVMLEQTGGTAKANQRYRWIWDTLSALEAPWEKWVDIAGKLTAKSSPAVYLSPTDPRQALVLERNKLVYRRLLSEASDRFTLRHPERLSTMEKLAQQYEMCGEWAAATKLSWRCLELRRDLLVTEVYEITKSDVAQTIVNLARQLRYKLDTYSVKQGDVVLPIYDSPDIADNFVSLTELYCCLCQQHFLTTKELLKHEDVFHLHAERMKRPEAVEHARELMKNGQYRNTNTVIKVNQQLIRSLELEAYQLFEDDLGEGHPSTVDAMERYALSLQANNDETSCREAINLLQKVLFKRQHIFRTNNPSTLETMRNLTKAYEDLPLKAGPTRTAMMEDLYHKVLREHDTRFKATQHHRVVRDALKEPATYFADDFRAVWTHERIKERYFRDVLPEQVRELGWEHPVTLRNLEGLATAIERSADHALEITESELTYRHVLAVRRQTLGWTHSDTLWSLACVIRMLAYKFIRLESIVDNPGEISTLYQELLNCCYIKLGKANFQTRRIQSEALIWLVERKEWQEATTIQINIIEAEYEQTEFYDMGEIGKLYTYMEHLVRMDPTDLPVSLITGTKTIYIAYATDPSRGPHHPDTLLAQKLRGVYFKRVGDFESSLDTFKMAYDGAVDAITVKQHSQRHRELRDISHMIIKHIYRLKSSITAEMWTAAFNHIIEAYPKMAAAFTLPTDVVDMAVEVGKLLYQECASQAVLYDWYRCCYEDFKKFFQPEDTSKFSAEGLQFKVNRDIEVELLAAPTLSLGVADGHYHPKVKKFVERILLELDPRSNTPLHYWWAVQSSFGYDHPNTWEAFGKLETVIWNENSNNREKAMILYQYVRKLEPGILTPESYEALIDLFTRTASIMSRHAYNTMSTNLWGCAYSLALTIGLATEWARMAAYRGRMADIAAETFKWYVGSTPASSSTPPSFTAEQVVKWYAEKVEILDEYSYFTDTVKSERIRTISNKVMFFCKRRQDPDECVEEFAAAFDTDRIKTQADKYAIEVQDDKISDLLAHGLPQYACAWCEWAARYLERADNLVTYRYLERAGDIYIKGDNIILAFTSYRSALSRLSTVHDDEATGVAMLRVKLAHKLADALQMSNSNYTALIKFGPTETSPDYWYITALNICETTPYIGLTHPTATQVLFGLQGYCRQIENLGLAYEPTRAALRKALEDKSNTKPTALLQATLAREKAKIQVACKAFKEAEKSYQLALEVLENCQAVGSAHAVTVQMLLEFAEFYESEENEIKNWEEAKALRQRIDEVAGTAGLEEDVVRGNRKRMTELVGLMIGQNVRNRHMQ